MSVTEEDEYNEDLEEEIQREVDRIRRSLENNAAKVILVNHMFEPKPENLIEVTVLPKSQTLKIARQLAIARATDRTRHEFWPDGTLKRYVHIDEIATQLYFRAQRSVDGRLLDLGGMLAETQILENFEEELKDYDEQ